MGNEIVKKAGDHILELFKEKLPDNFLYHNFDHTSGVVRSAKEIGKKADLKDDEQEIVLLAAWFHDSGYVNTYKGHEAESAKLAEEFLKNQGYKLDNIEKVKKCILATEFPSDPQNEMEEVLCDADMAHLGSEDYPNKTELLRMEWERVLNKKITDAEWLRSQVNFIAEHRFYTKYARKEWENIKLNHMIKLQKKYKKEISQAKTDEKQKEKMRIEKEKLDRKKEESTKAIRGIETMFRNTVRTHVEFSGMADNKANIMISINTLVIGIMFTGIVKEIYDYSYLIIPVIMLLTVNLVTIILAVIVATPKITQGTFTKEDVHNKRTNLLFFGNFYNMSRGDFHWGMNEMINDKDYLYDSMITDFYYLGQVLGKKYKYLSICYRFFLIGIILSTIAFIIALSYRGSGTI